MRASPRTWPSIRFNLFTTWALASFCMGAIYPYRVYEARSNMPRETHHSDNHAGCTQDTAAQGVIDPVCGMTVDPHTTKHRHEYRGHSYYFCSAGCRTKFISDPQKYLDPRPRAAEPVPEGAIYTCPMHP